MKTIFSIILFSLFIQTATAQSIKKDSSYACPQLFIEYSPLIQLTNIVSLNVGADFKRFQAGVNIQFGSHDLNHALTVTTFENYGDLHIHHYRTEGLFFKTYLNKNRKGFYAGCFVSIIQWDVEDHLNDLSEKLTGYYVGPYGGYRWFPFKKYFYVDANFGTQILLNSTEKRFVGNES